MLQADWSFLVNEPAIDIAVTTFDAAPLAIMVLGKLTGFVLPFLKCIFILQLIATN